MRWTQLDTWKGYEADAKERLAFIRTMIKRLSRAKKLRAKKRKR